MHRGGIISLRTSWLKDFMDGCDRRREMHEGFHHDDVQRKDRDALGLLGSHALGESITGIPKIVVEEGQNENGVANAKWQARKHKR